MGKDVGPIPDQLFLWQIIDSTSLVVKLLVLAYILILIGYITYNNMLTEDVYIAFANVYIQFSVH